MYKNKYFSVLGDSISTLAGYNPPQCAVYYDWEHKRMADIFAPEDTWWGKVIDALQGKLLVNNSYSGSTVSKHPSYEVPSYGCSDARTADLGAGISPDVVMIFMGFNDWGSGVTLQPQGEEKAHYSFAGAYEIMLDKIRKNYPQAEIWCLTLPRSCLQRDSQREIPVLRAGRHIQEFNAVIRACAEKAGCKTVDLWNPAVPYDTIDGFHPNAAGMAVIARCVLENVERWCAE